jgi:uncharacterized protein (TIGR00255 family)
VDRIMIRSMTGYGSGSAAVGEGRVVIEMRALNHRYLDVRMRLPNELAEHAPQVEEVARRRLERGRIEISGRIEGVTVGMPVLDRPRARAAFEQLCELRDELRPGEPVPLTLLVCVPDLFQVAPGPEPALLAEAVRAAAEQAATDLDTMREREGAALGRELTSLLERMNTHIDEIRQGVPRSVQEYRERLRERVRRLMADQEVALDEGRLEHEVALFADRSDVAEELARLSSHGDQIVDLLRTPDARVGRRLDFLLQEMAREVNTTGAKTQAVGTTRLVVELKADIGRMREQVQNVL